MTFILDIGLAFMFAVPIFVSNAVPALLGGGYPVDGYRCFVDKKRILNWSSFQKVKMKSLECE